MATTPSPLPHDPTRPPSCSWRGLLIDSARTFWTVPVMELIITVMARYRLNVLHWHLTDNAGWRVPIPGYPALTSIGAQIPRAPEDWYDHACAPERSGTWRTSPARTSQGFYSDANIRHLVRFAAQRNIRIIPEISIPSCAGAAIRAYPHVGNPALAHAPIQERNTTLWPIASSLHFIEAALHHVCDLFPSPIIHIGAPKTDWSPWENDPTLERAGLTSGRDIERLFIERAMRTLHFHGRRAATWDTVTRAYNCHPQEQSFSHHATADRTPPKPLRRAPPGFWQTHPSSHSAIPRAPAHPQHLLRPHASSMNCCLRHYTANGSRESKLSHGPRRSQAQISSSTTYSPDSSSSPKSHGTATTPSHGNNLPHSSTETWLICASASPTGLPNGRN